ncbi:MAG: SHOCT domain-containing protein [Clostridiaceae bacterium]|jgi:hypothetical protein|nr:SHOCT domain-containing protein [Clostridiaceae bacterium]
MHTNNGKGFLKASGVTDLIMGILCIPAVILTGIGGVMIMAVANTIVEADSPFAGIPASIAAVLGAIFFVIAAIFLVIMIVNFVFASKAFKISRLQVAEAKLRTGGLIVAGVLQVIAGLFLIIVSISGSSIDGAEEVAGVVSALIAPAVFLILPAVFKFVAVSKIKKEELPELEPAPYGANPYGYGAPYGGGYAPGYPQQGYVPQDQTLADQSLMQELERLATLRATGVISNAEYEERKANISRR